MEFIAIEDADDLIVSEYKKQPKSSAQETNVTRRRREELWPNRIMARDMENDADVNGDLANTRDEVVLLHDLASLY